MSHFYISFDHPAEKGHEKKLTIYGRLLNVNLIYTILGLIRPKHTTNLNFLRICVECESRLHNFWFDKVRKIIKK